VPLNKTPISLYVHVPFCAHKCEYCAFYSHAPGDLVQRYTGALLAEMEMLPPFRPRTIFFGGGTPTLLTL
jgi:oxygen-independent coproporphyrinogen-3 oxidase